MLRQWSLITENSLSNYRAYMESVKGGAGAVQEGGFTRTSSQPSTLATVPTTGGCRANVNNKLWTYFDALNGNYIPIGLVLERLVPTSFS